MPTFKTDSYWSLSPNEVLEALNSDPSGLSGAEAERRLVSVGPNLLRIRERATTAQLFLRQFKNPLVLILFFAAAISILLGEWIDTLIVLLIVFASAVAGFVQEYNASNAVEKLRSRVTTRATVLRDGQSRMIPAVEVVPGDIAILSAGSLVPADGLVLQADDFFVSQAVLTGETFPAEKKPAQVSKDASLSERINCVFAGTTVRSGSAHVLIVQTGRETVFGQVAERLTLRPPETEFERGIRRFGNMLTQFMSLLVLIVFAANVILHKPPVDSLLFAVALAVGMAPELLPAIVSITLSKGAQSMAKRGVIVRQLASIENFGSMDVFCTDKTGTLTLGVVSLDGTLDTRGRPSKLVSRYAYLNAHFQTGLDNPLDEAITAGAQPDISDVVKTEEIPYDFVRKRLTIVVKEKGRDTTPLMITKGALDNILAISTLVQDDNKVVPLDETLAQIRQRYLAWSDQGFRVLGVAIKKVEPKQMYTSSDERNMVFCGFLLFFDPPKQGVEKAVENLARLGVQLKIITGDNQRVALHVAQLVGMKVTGIITGADMNTMRDEALWQKAERGNLFAEVDPNQKERIIAALRKTGHVVGYLGDGINDAPALHAADVGVSVDSAVDVAKEAADFVLLKQDLDVLRQGIEEGRRTFANTMKYIFTTVSANFGNMFSMAILSPFLPFLPLLPKQILLNNFLSDIPAMTIATDAVDPELVDRPRRWDIKFIRNFMITFGLVSSVFDFATFGILIYVLKVAEEQFRTGWFVESLLTELFILLILRTRRPFFKSKPGRYMWISTLLVGLIALALPYVSTAELFGFVPLPPTTMLVLIVITVTYAAANELAKKTFFARIKA